MPPRLDYWTRIPHPGQYLDLVWNLPERKEKAVLVLGGHLQQSAGTIKCGELLAQKLPIAKVEIGLPASLIKQLPPVANFSFLPANESGSLAKSGLLNTKMGEADFNLIYGELSRNAETAVAVANGICANTTPTLITRDAVDLLAPEMGRILLQEHLTLLTSFASLQKVFRAVYYPKMLSLSMPLPQAVEALHKFSLSYPVLIVTLHQDQILIAHTGKIFSTPMTEVNYSPMSLWGGALAGKIVTMQLFHPERLEACMTALVL